MRYQKNHNKYVGQLFREGNFIRRVTWVLGPFYGVAHYSFGIFSERNRPWIPVRELPLNAERMIQSGALQKW